MRRPMSAADAAAAVSSFSTALPGTREVHVYTDNNVP